ncbi:MAG: hypothetical protein ABUS54_11905 [Actinomycetota bacterium]
MRWWGPLIILAAVRVAIPVAAVADRGSKLPGIPEFNRDPRLGGLVGDATGFYAATREFMAGWARMPHALLGLLVLVALAAAAALAVAWRRRPALRPWLVPSAVCAAGLLVCVDVHWMKPSGAAVFGWPLVWAIALLPFRAVGLLTHALAWDVALVLQLVFVALTVIAAAYLGRNATGKRWVGVAAAACWALWPLLVGLLAGHHAWTNGQWEVDAGLHGYSEPLSTLLVTAAAALLLSPAASALQLSLAGCALSLATLTKLSNALLAAIALVVVVLQRRWRHYLAGALSLAPLVAAYWPISYPKLFHNRQSWPSDPFDPAHVVSSWTHSSIFYPRTLLIVTLLALLGVAALRRPWAAALVLAFLLLNPVFYSFYANTAKHPRFLYASLPFLFVLWAGSLETIRRCVARR